MLSASRFAHQGKKDKPDWR